MRLEVAALPHDVAICEAPTLLGRLVDLLVVRHCVLRAGQVVRVPLGEAQAERDLPLGIVLGEQPLVDRLGQLRPLAGRMRDALEVAGGLVVVDVHLEGSQERIECLRLVLQLFFEHTRDLRKSRALVHVVARLETREV